MEVDGDDNDFDTVYKHRLDDEISNLKDDDNEDRKITNYILWIFNSIFIDSRKYILFLKNNKKIPITFARIIIILSHIQLNYRRKL